MKQLKRLLALALALTLALGTGAMRPVYAQEEIAPVTYTWINPMYADHVTEADIAALASDPPVTLGEPEYLSDEEIPAAAREYLKARVGSFTLYLETTVVPDKAALGEFIEAALAHTGVPTEGDYLRWQHGGIQVGYEGGQVLDNTYYIPLNFTAAYYTDADQEEAVDAEVERILDALDLSSATDYQKTCGIYDYLTENVTYDYTNLNDKSYTLKHSAYAALLDGTAVCQGYALAFYRLALELGLKTRIVTGTSNGGGHAWNIVKLGDYYYDLDSTWDAGMKESGYSYFLKGSESFDTEHVRDDAYTTAAFLADYPVDTKDYVRPVIVSGYCGAGYGGGKNVVWTFEPDTGKLTLSGSQSMKDYYKDEQPWAAYLDQIRTVTVESTVVNIGDFAFYGCSNLTSVSLADSINRFGVSTFANCPSLSEVALPKYLSIIPSATFRGCSALKSIKIPNSVTQINLEAFSGCTGLETVYYTGTEEDREAITGDIDDSLKNATWIYGTLGDFNEDDVVNEDDAIYVLRHVLSPSQYPVSTGADVNKDSVVNEDDAIYLLRHVLSPDTYPL